jgi:hypothetical protein
LYSLWQIDTGYLCAGIISHDGLVVEAAPILKWTVGKRINIVRSWVNSRHGKLILVPLDKVQRKDDNKVPTSKAALKNDRPHITGTKKAQRTQVTQQTKERKKTKK